jgi:GTPase SAR1 family protein
LNFDPDLLSGFLQAIESIGEELANPIQEIKFSNWVIYINKAADITLRLIVTDRIPREKIDDQFRRLGEIAKEFFPTLAAGLTLKKDQMVQYFAPILEPIIWDKGSDETKSQRISRDDTTTRICFAGLSAVGKTSMRKLFLDHLTTDEALQTKPTLGVENARREVDFLQTTLNIQEFGGQAFLRQKYLINKSLWISVSALIFVIDLQNPEKFKESVEYLHSIWALILEMNKTVPTLALFLHKYDPSKRAELVNNIRQCWQLFSEFQDRCSFHLTSLFDGSVNVAIIKTIYLSLPSVMLQKMLADEFLKDLQQTVLPQYIPLINNPEEPIAEDLAMEIKASAILFGRTYGNKLQTAWIKYLSENAPSTPVQARDQIEVRKEGTNLLVTVKKDPKNPNLFALVLEGALLGITKSMQFKPPRLIQQDPTAVAWEISIS